MFRRLSATILLLAAAALSFAGCGKVVMDNNTSTTTIGSAPYIEGSGTVTTETRQLDGFHAVSVTDGMTVFVKLGDAPSVDVTADDNLVGMISTGVQNGTLLVTVDGSLTTHNQMRVDVTTATPIDSVAQDGGSTVDIEDFSADAAVVSVSGGSTLRAGGKIATLQLRTQGGSTADMRNLKTTVATVSVDTGSTALVNVSESITGQCTTGSTLKISGAASTAGVTTDTGCTVAHD
jgi:hypothetical protein